MKYEDEITGTTYNSLRRYRTDERLRQLATTVLMTVAKDNKIYLTK